MPLVGSPQYVPLEHVSATSSGTANVQPLIPSGDKKAHGVWLTVETTPARVTFDGTSPGAGGAPGLVIPIGTAPLFFPFSFGRGTPAIRFASASAGNSTVNAMFVQ